MFRKAIPVLLAMPLTLIFAQQVRENPTAMTAQTAASAQNAPAGRLCRVKLLSDAEPDLTSIETVVNSVVRPGMTNEDKCLALFWLAHDHRYWYPAFFPVQDGRPVYDPVMMLNCYPATICQQDAALTTAIWTAAGFDVRYWQLRGHTTGEVFYDGAWRNFDATNGQYARAADGSAGGVDVVQKRFYKPGASRIEPFDDFAFGHEMNLSLRTGEIFTRHWSVLGDSRDYWVPSNTPDKRADDRGDHRLGLNKAMARKPYRWNTGGAGIANGLWEFQPDVARKDWQSLFDAVTNTRADADGRIRPADASKPAELTWRVATPYVITGAWLEGDFTLGQDGEAKAFVSADNGGTWKEFAIAAGRQRVSLHEPVADTFGYLVRLSLKGAASVQGLKSSTAVQLNPLSLPALKNGRNVIRVSAGEQVETIAVQPDLNSPAYRALVAEESNVVLAKEVRAEKWASGLMAKEAGQESAVVFRLTAPGDVRRVRWGGRFRSGKGDANEMYYSTDGKDWKRQDLSGRWTYPDSPTPNQYTPVWEATEGWPAGTRTVYLKYAFRRAGGDKTLASSLRMDVDYAPPGAVSQLPIEVTYCWEEEADGKLVEKTHTEVIRQAPFLYTILVGGKDKPLMKWVRTWAGETPAATTEPATSAPTTGPGNVP